VAKQRHKKKERTYIYAIPS